MRTAGILLLVALAALGVSFLKWRDVLGLDPLRRPPLPALSRETNFSLKIDPLTQMNLDRPLPAGMRCRGPRHDCVRQVEGKAGLRVIPYWGALSTTYVGATEIDVDVGGLRPLDALLRVADEKRDGPPSAWLVYGRQVVLSTPERLRRMSVLEDGYDVSDLLPAPTSGKRPEYDRAVRRLTRRIAAKVDPPSWKDAGGPFGRVYESMGFLHVTQTARNHRLVAAELARVRWERRWARFGGKAAAVVAPSVALAGLVRAGVLLRRRRRARLMAARRCVDCGYDLRATPERCPECGRAVAAGR